ncbi:MAG TPA: hypothetical protein DD732_02945 [Rhizobiales bacterium]|jgi:hypothetical protein|nr:hypothetical protein [Hyphomicrobiales bacterium]
MSIFDSLLGSGSGSEASQLVHEYMRAKLVEDAGEGIFSHYAHRESDQLDLADKRLSIRLKKKQLGVPMSTDDYEEAENKGISFPNQAANILSHSEHARIPTPGFLSASSGRGLMETSFPKPQSATEALLGRGMRTGASNASRDLGLVARIFRR